MTRMVGRRHESQSGLGGGDSGFVTSGICLPGNGGMPETSPKLHESLIPIAKSLLFALTLMLSACAVNRAADISTPLTIQPLALSVSGDSTMPRLFSNGSHAMVSWVEGDAEKAALKYTERTASG